MAEINEKSDSVLRRNLGILGVGLPIVLAFGSRFELEPSISDFYYTDLGVVFTGILIAFGLYLFSYKGYDIENDKVSDNWLTNFAGTLAIITALVPTACHENCTPVIPPNSHSSEWIGNIHLACATGFFLIIGWMSFDRFSRSKKPERKQRNKLYRICGIGVWISLLLAGMTIFFETNWFGHFDVFIFETLGLWFFGTAWLVKGDGLKRFGV